MTASPYMVFRYLLCLFIYPVRSGIEDSLVASQGRLRTVGPGEDHGPEPPDLPAERLVHPKEP